MPDKGYAGQNIEEVLSEKGEIMTSTSGTSMYPMLRHRRDMVVVETVRCALKKNDVPLYRVSGDKLLLHRILKVSDKGYTIRGDNRFQKEFVKPEQIIGVLKCFYREGKYVDCATSKKYKVYIFLNRASYPVRLLWRKYIRPFLGKTKRFLLHK